MFFNDQTSASRLLSTRRSGKAREMTEPGPCATQVGQMIEIASRVPDHGKLAPWRFVIVDPAARAKLGTMIATAYAQDKPGASQTEIEAMRGFTAHAPCLIVLMARVNPASHIPVWEQELSVGAAAMQLLNAAHAMGFVGNWLTGWAAYSPAVTAALGETGERIAGFFFIGTANRALEERWRPEPGTVTRTWTGN